MKILSVYNPKGVIYIKVGIILYMLSTRINFVGSLKDIDKSIANVHGPLLFATVAFAAFVVLALTATILFRHKLRKLFKMKFISPIVGLLLLIIPVTEDYFNLVVNNHIDHFFETYLQSGDVISKFSIYFVALAFILRNKNMVSTISPLIFVALTMSIASREVTFYAFNIIEYALVVSSVLAFLVITKKRYSTINFIDSLFVYGTIAAVIIASRIWTAKDFTDVSEIKVQSFNLFSQYDGGWEQIIVWSAILIIVQFTYLFLSTKFIFKFNSRETLSLIRLEDKFRKANIEIEIKKDDIITVHSKLLNETENIDLQTEVLFKDELFEIDLDQAAKLQKVFIKSKGIRSPSAF